MHELHCHKAVSKDHAPPSAQAAFSLLHSLHVSLSPLHLDLLALHHESACKIAFSRENPPIRPLHERIQFGVQIIEGNSFT